MDKKTLAGVSLVAALPAAWATYLMVMFFLTYVSEASWTMIFLIIITMLTAVTLMLLPAGIFIKSREREKKTQAAMTKPAAGRAAATVEVSAEIAESGEMQSSAEFVHTGEFESSSEFEASSEFEMSSGELQTGGFEDSDAFELDDDEDEQK